MEKIQGHGCSFYYGTTHLLVKINSFLAKDLQDNEKCVCFLEENLVPRLKEQANKYYSKAPQLKFSSIQDLLVNASSEDKLKEALFNLTSKSEDWLRVKILFQVSPTVRNQNLEQFLKLENNLEEVVSELKLTWLCLYDISDFIKGNPDGDFLLEQALNKHDFLFNSKEVHQLNKDVKNEKKAF